MPLASAGSTMAGWTSATAENEVPGWAVRETICIPRKSVIHSQSQRIVVGLEHPNLSTPAHAHRTPLSDPGRLLLNLLQQPWHLFRRIRRARRPREEVSKLLLLLLRIGREGAAGKRFAEEKVGHEDLEWVVGVCVGEDVGALDGLGGEAEDVVDDEDGGGGGGGTGGVALRAVQVDVFAFFLVTFRYGGGHVAAGFAVALDCFHDDCLVSV